MEVSTGRSNRFTSSLGDYYPISQFKQLSQRVEAKKGKNAHALSPREEVYKSLLNEIRAKGNSNVGSLVKKASGILRLSQNYNNSIDLVSSFAETNNNTKRLRTKKSSAKKIVGDEIQSLGLKTSEVVSRLAQNGGDFSEIWNYIESNTDSSSMVSNSIYSTKAPSRQSALSRASTATTTRSLKPSQSRGSNKPPWRYFANEHGLSSGSSTSLESSVHSNPWLIHDGTSTATYKIPKDSTWSASRTSSVKEKNDVTDRKLDYMKHVFVMKGQVITFKGKGFEKFTNWFGDITLLKQIGSDNKPLFRKELDLTGFKNEEIRMKLYEGYKLVIEAYRPNRENSPPLRFKSTIALPKGVTVERLIMCRSPFGRLIIQHISSSLTAL